jgi:hypothetical protein
MASQPLTLVPSVLPASVCLHRWSRLPGAVGLFGCARCGDRGVCPGCLNSLQVALVAADAGFTVLWCADHRGSGEVGVGHEA